MCVTEHKKGWSINLDELSAPSILVLKHHPVLTISAWPVVIETVREQCLVKATPEESPNKWGLYVPTPNERHVFIRVEISREAAEFLAKDCGIKNNMTSEATS